MIKRYPGKRGAYGLPYWLLMALEEYATSESARARILMRLNRTARVMDGRNKTLLLGKELYQAQNPGATDDPDWPD